MSSKTKPPSEPRTQVKRAPKTSNPYSKLRKRGPEFSMGRNNTVLGAIESGGKHPRTQLYQRVRHFTQQAADKRANDLRKKGWTDVYVLDTGSPVILRGMVLPGPVLPDYDDTREGLSLEQAMDTQGEERQRVEP